MGSKGIFLVLSKPKSAEQEAEYNRWYSETHVRDSLLLPGFTRGRRFKLADTQLLPGKADAPGFDYLAIYEIDDLDAVPDAQRLMPELAKVSAEFMSPTVDPEYTKAFIFEELLDTTAATELPDGVTFGTA